MKKKMLSLFVTMAMIMSMFTAFAENADTAADMEQVTIAEETEFADDYEERLETLSSASSTCGGNLTWTFEDGTLTISGKGDMTDYTSNSSVPWYSNRSSITSVAIDSGVTSIGAYAFSGCSALKNITIPDSVACIGFFAFSGCSGLKSITIIKETQQI